MDIYCPTCAEPWEIDSLHDEVSARYPEKPWFVATKPEGFSHQDSLGLWHDQKEYEKYFNIVQKEFRRDGCLALRSYTTKHNEATINPQRNGIYGQLMDFAGDDIDFAASMMEDAESFGLFD